MADIAELEELCDECIEGSQHIEADIRFKLQRTVIDESSPIHYSVIDFYHDDVVFSCELPIVDECPQQGGYILEGNLLVSKDSLYSTIGNILDFLRSRETDGRIVSCVGMKELNAEFTPNGLLRSESLPENIDLPDYLTGHDFYEANTFE